MLPTRTIRLPVFTEVWAQQLCLNARLIRWRRDCLNVGSRIWNFRVTEVFNTCGVGNDKGLGRAECAFRCSTANFKTFGTIATIAAGQNDSKLWRRVVTGSNVDAKKTFSFCFWSPRKISPIRIRTRSKQLPIEFLLTASILWAFCDFFYDARDACRLKRKLDEAEQWNKCRDTRLN